MRLRECYDINTCILCVFNNKYNDNNNNSGAQCQRGQCNQNQFSIEKKHYFHLSAHNDQINCNYKQKHAHTHAHTHAQWCINKSARTMLVDLLLITHWRTSLAGAQSAPTSVAADQESYTCCYYCMRLILLSSTNVICC